MKPMESLRFIVSNMHECGAFQNLHRMRLLDRRIFNQPLPYVLIIVSLLVIVRILYNTN